MKIYELLAQPENWCRGTPARNAAGRPVAYWDDNARCWCLLGAAAKLYSMANYHEVVAKLAAKVPGGNVCQWQDHFATHDMVVALALKLDI